MSSAGALSSTSSSCRPTDDHTELFVSLSPLTPSDTLSEGGSCWGLPIDMLREWYRAAEEEQESLGNSEAEAATDRAGLSSSSTDVCLPFRVTVEEVAAAAELSGDPFTSPLSS